MGRLFGPTFFFWLGWPGCTVLQFQGSGVPPYVRKNVRSRRSRFHFEELPGVKMHHFGDKYTPLGVSWGCCDGFPVLWGWILIVLKNTEIGIGVVGWVEIWHAREGAKRPNKLTKSFRWFSCSKPHPCGATNDFNEPC